MPKKFVDIAEMGLVEALRTNPRRLSPKDIRTLLKEAADEIEELRTLWASELASRITEVKKI